MSWTDEKQREEFERMQQTIIENRAKIKNPCPKCGYGEKTGENKHTESFSCGHSCKKEKQNDSTI